MKPFRVFRYRNLVEDKLGILPADMLLAFFNAQARPQFDARQRLRHSIRTLAQWQAERRRLRAAFIRAIGGPRITGQTRATVVRETRRGPVIIRSVLISPFPGHVVPANLYLPANASGPLPVVIHPQGHDDQGKNGGGRAPFFACNGYACLIFDFFGAGERCFPLPDGATFAPSSGHHNILGNQMGLYGYNLNWFMMYDTMACIDYVTSLPEIDASRVAMTGASGGGTETFLVTALDERVRVAAPGASVHSFRNTLYPGDAEQMFFDHVAQGMDYPDLASFLVAPRPMLVLANTHDIWDLPSTRYTVGEAKRFYALHGAANRLSLRVWEGGHQYNDDQVTAVIHWFDRWLGHRHAFVTPGAAARLCKPRESDVLTTHSGTLVGDGYPSARTAFRRHLARTGAPPSASPAAVRRWLNSALGRPARKVDWDLVEPFTIGGFEARRIMFAPEPGLWLPAEIVLPKEAGRGKKPRGVTLLLDELGRQQGVEWQIGVAASGRVAVRPDLRGWGETAFAETWEEWENWTQLSLNGNRMRETSYAKGLGRSMPVDRAKDVRALLTVLGQMNITGRTTLWGRRGGALVALLAGAGDRRVHELVLERFLYSFGDLLSHDVPTIWMDNVIEGTLARGIDVAELCRAFRPRKISLRDLHDARMRPVKV